MLDIKQTEKRKTTHTDGLAKGKVGVPRGVLGKTTLDTSNLACLIS